MAIAATSDVGGKVVGAIRDAARVTGTGFEYLLKTAMRESNFNPKLKSSKSSATGLFQFIDQTWLATVKQSGASLGYGRYANAIVRTSAGRYVVPNASMRRQVMNLRYDPSANAVMAGAFTKANATRLTNALGRAPSDGELYIAHVLGQSGAAKLITTAENAPSANAAHLFPHAARANRSIFFDKQGGARSSADVYRALVAQHDATPTPPAPVLAAAPVAPTAPASAATATLAAAAAPGIATMPSGTAAAAAPATGPMFSSLFSSDRREAVSPFVRHLWGAPGAGSLQPASAPALLAPAVAQPGTAQSSAAVMPAAAVNAAQAVSPASPHPFQFMRPDAPNQGAWPI
ncbi:MAG TPA: transglycosylase SLT domain-containing protein [Xanthobacteraceae bacterium]|nr:transglycosylase SLT domain-containing protein [Xanthobacteraceae bacterium]